MTFQGHFLCVNELQDALLEQAFPLVDRKAVYTRMESWLYANPRKRPKKNWERFVHTWFCRTVPQQPLPEAQVGRGPEGGFRCRDCKQTFGTHAEACNHECK